MRNSKGSNSINDDAISTQSRLLLVEHHVPAAAGQYHGLSSTTHDSRLDDPARAVDLEGGAGSTENAEVGGEYRQGALDTGTLSTQSTIFSCVRVTSGWSKITTTKNRTSMKYRFCVFLWV